MSGKRDRDSSLDELCESTRTPSIPWHLSASSIADTPSHDDVPSLLNSIHQLRLQLLQEQQLRERSEQEQREQAHQLQLEKNIRQQEQQLRQQEQRLRQQEQQLREQQEQLLLAQRIRCKQLDTDLHDIATRLHREQQLREQQQRELVLQLHQERQLRAEEQRQNEEGLPEEVSSHLQSTQAS